MSKIFFQTSPQQQFPKKYFPQEITFFRNCCKKPKEINNLPQDLKATPSHNINILH